MIRPDHRAKLDAEYYARRAVTERSQANAATDPTVAQIHLTLATLYEDRVADLALKSRLEANRGD